MNPTSMSPLCFVHVGFGNVVCANRVTLVLNSNTANAKRLIKVAKRSTPRRYMDLSLGRGIKCIMLMDDGSIIGCGLTYRTLLQRLNGIVLGAYAPGSQKAMEVKVSETEERMAEYYIATSVEDEDERDEYADAAEAYDAEYDEEDFEEDDLEEEEYEEED